MNSIFISLDFESGELYAPRTDKDAERFINRLKQDRMTSPARTITAFQLFQDGQAVMIE